MFPLKDLPPEIRTLIYPLSNNLQLQPDYRAPALLIALVPDRELYLEAYDLYRGLNAVVTPRNLQDFGQLSEDVLGRIKHLRLRFQPSEVPEGRDPLILPPSHPLLAHNNLCTLTLDFTTPIQGATTPSFSKLVRTLVEASRPGINTIHLIVDAWIPRALQKVENVIPMRNRRTMGIRALNEGLGIKARLERVVTLDMGETWVWMGKNGEDRWRIGERGRGVLRWRPEGWFGVFGL